MPPLGPLARETPTTTAPSVRWQPTCQPFQKVSSPAAHRWLHQYPAMQLAMPTSPMTSSAILYRTAMLHPQCPFSTRQMIRGPFLRSSMRAKTWCAHGARLSVPSSTRPSLALLQSAAPLCKLILPDPNTPASSEHHSPQLVQISRLLPQSNAFKSRPSWCSP